MGSVNSPLAVAASSGQLDVCRSLIAANAHLVNSADNENGRTALQCAALHGRVKIVQFLLPLVDDKDAVDVRIY